jgi:hypothetical protein
MAAEVGNFVDAKTAATLACAMCCRVPKQVYAAGACQHIGCWLCLGKLRLCHMCRGPMEIVPAIVATQIADLLETKCAYVEEDAGDLIGCTWRGRGVQALQVHRLKCPHVIAGAFRRTCITLETALADERRKNARLVAAAAPRRSVVLEQQPVEDAAGAAPPRSVYPGQFSGGGRAFRAARENRSGNRTRSRSRRLLRA